MMDPERLLAREDRLDREQCESYERQAKSNRLYRRMEMAMWSLTVICIVLTGVFIILK